MAPEPMPAEEQPKRRTGLLIDWGGVLTTNLFASFHAHCVQAGIDPKELAGRFRRDPAARELLIALETGELEEVEFETKFAELLGVEPDGLVDGLFAGVKPDVAMVEAVIAARSEARCASSLSLARSSISVSIKASRLFSSTASASNCR